MTIELKVYDNGDHTCLVWLPSDEKAIPDCRGFTIHRTLKPNGGGPARDSYLHGFVGFSDADKLDPTAPWKFPLQRYMWWDYLVDPGDVVQYSVVPVVGPDQGRLSLSLADASAQTPPMTITGQASAHVCAYFNKGIVSAQWVARALATVGKSAKLDSLIAEPGNALRNALSGLLRPQLLDLLDDVKKNGGEIYAALYELNDPELIPRLAALGQKCHLILANGAFNSKKPDENSTVRAQLRGKVDLHDRLVGQGHFAHNKFVVACDSAGKPQRVLSGSTNWTMTGLCTQANNGIIVDDPNLGAFFINQWNLLKAAGNAYPQSLMAANSKSSILRRRWRHGHAMVRANRQGRGSRLCAPAYQRRGARHSVPVLQSGRIRAGRQAGAVDAPAEHSSPASARNAELRCRSLHPRRRQPGDCGPDHAGPGNARQGRGCRSGQPEPGEALCERQDRPDSRSGGVDGAQGDQGRLPRLGQRSDEPGRARA